jgi:hypothetical protein
LVVDANHFPVKLSLKVLHHFDVAIHRVREDQEGLPQPPGDQPPGKFPKKINGQVSSAVISHTKLGRTPRHSDDADLL